MSTQKKAASTKSKLIIIGLGLVVFAAWKFPVYFFVGIGLILAITILLFIKNARFHALIMGKLPKFGHKPTAQIRQSNGIKTAYTGPTCPKCSGQLLPVANFPKFFYCAHCDLITEKI
jgi:hypothetical protein